MSRITYYLSALLICVSTLAFSQTTKPSTTPATGTTPKPSTPPASTTTTPRPSTNNTPPAPQVITVNVPTPEATPAEDLKPEAGNISAEVNFTPFGGAPIGISYIRGRYFIDDLIALRVGLAFSLQTINAPANTDLVTYSGGGSVISWGLLPGIEFHFEGTRRLSPFVGAQIDLLARNSGYTLTTTPTGGTASTVTMIGTAPSAGGTTTSDPTKDNYFNPGLSALIGCDFYFSKHIYLGTEFGIGFSIQTRGDKTITSTGSGVTNSSVTKGAASFGIAPVYNSAIRVGFVF